MNRARCEKGYPGTIYIVVMKGHAFHTSCARLSSRAVGICDRRTFPYAIVIFHLALIYFSLSRREKYEDCIVNGRKEEKALEIRDCALCIAF